MRKANYALRLQPSLKAAAERIAAAEGVSLNQLINVAVAEKLSAMETASYFSDRAARARPGAILAWIDSAGDEPPQAGDEV
jgi:hypothetical protein